MTNAVLARETVHGQFLLVTATEIPRCCGCGSFNGPYIGTDLLQTLHLHGDVLQPATVDEFRYGESGPTVRTLPSLFGEPLGDANVTAQLGAMWAQVSLAQFLHTDEAPEDIAKGLRVDERGFSFLRNS